MKKILDTINNFIINNDIIIINCYKYNYIIPIKNGSIDNCCIINELKETIGLIDININDNIIVFYRDIENKNIKPIKIIKLFNYVYNDTSDSENNI